MRPIFYIFCCPVFVIFSCAAPEKKTVLQEQVQAVVVKDSVPKEKVYDSETALKLDSLFNRWVLTNKFNGNVLVAQHGKVIYKKCVGYADHEKNTLLNDHSVFQLASVSKQFTAAAIMLLEERGLLKYSDTLQKYFPEFPYKNITIDMLLSHRSGLANYMYFCEGYCTDYEKAISNQQVLEWMNVCKPEPYKKPGRRFQYNNTNYCLLVAVVEKVSGMSFDRFLKTQIFEPLNMKDTWVKKDPSDTLRDNMTQGYEYRWRKAEVNYLDGVLGDKNVYSSIEDMFVWDQALYTEKLLKQKTIENAFTPRSRELWGGKNYGYGWRLLSYPDGTKLVYHNGWWHGYNNSFYRRLNDQTTIIILCNRRNNEIFKTQLIFDILDKTSKKIEVEGDV